VHNLCTLIQLTCNDVGAGGTQRLPRLVGVSEATKLMTQGRLISSNEAFKLGIVDNVFKSSKITEDLIDAAVAFSLSDEVQGTPVNERRVSNMAVKGDVSEELFKNLYGEVFKQSRGFVAPLSILEAIKAAATSESFEEGLQKERELFEGLMKGPQSKALQYIFFSERRSSTLPADIVSTVTPAPIVSAAVVGGGTMGCGIAISCANAGIPTTLLEVIVQKFYLASCKLLILRTFSTAL
jgi:3-hydroxyacyl-CoA dehydrogenase